jgi:hypothetical protein
MDAPPQYENCDMLDVIITKMCLNDSAVRKGEIGVRVIWRGLD